MSDDKPPEPKPANVISYSTPEDVDKGKSAHDALQNIVFCVAAAVAALFWLGGGSMAAAIGALALCALGVACAYFLTQRR